MSAPTDAGIWMKFTFAKYAATASLCVAAMAVATGTANAEPVVAPPAISGTDQGVAYSTSVDGGSVKTILDAGVFKLDQTTTTIDIVDASGSTIGSVPLTYQVGDKQFSLANVISGGGSTLTLTPGANPIATAPVGLSLRHDVSSQSRFADELNRSLYGAGMPAAIGAGIGLVLGCIVGVFVGCIPGVLAGAAIGALVGIVNTGGAPLQTAAFSYFSGQP